MKLILHIGTEKTGTSSIQKYLYENRELFANNGFYIPQILGKENHRKVPGYCMRIDAFDDFHESHHIVTIEDKEVFKKNFEKEFKNYFVNLPSHIHTVIISSEHFHSRLTFQDEVDSVQELFSQFFDEVKIVVYLRRQIDLATSLYSTELKSGNVLVGINEFVKKRCRPESHYFNYKKFLSLWGNTFGLKALDVRLFDKQEFYQNNLILDFTHSISENLVEKIKEEVKQPKMENESLTVFGQDILNIINTYIPSFVKGSGPNEIFINLRNIIISECAGKGKQPDYEIARITMESFFEINNAIKEKYFPNRTELFDPDLEKFKIKQHFTPKNELDIFEYMIKTIDKSIAKKDIDTMRDIAISLEETDLKKAYELMKIVEILRPNGSYIKAKVVEYEKIFKNNVYNGSS